MTKFNLTNAQKVMVFAAKTGLAQLLGKDAKVFEFVGIDTEPIRPEDTHARGTVTLTYFGQEIVLSVRVVRDRQTREWVKDRVELQSHEDWQLNEKRLSSTLRWCPVRSMYLQPAHAVNFKGSSDEELVMVGQKVQGIFYALAGYKAELIWFSQPLEIKKGYIDVPEAFSYWVSDFIFQGEEMRSISDTLSPGNYKCVHSSFPARPPWKKLNTASEVVLRGMLQERRWLDIEWVEFPSLTVGDQVVTVQYGNLFINGQEVSKFSDELWAQICPLIERPTDEWCEENSYSEYDRGQLRYREYQVVEHNDGSWELWFAGGAPLAPGGGGGYGQGPARKMALSLHLHGR